MAPRTKEQIAQIRSESSQKILMAALELFATDGFAGTSVNAIAKKAGVSKGLIYNYFESKEDIVKGLVDMMLQIAEDMMKRSAEKPAATPREELKNLVDIFFETITHQIEMMRWILPLAFQMSRFSFVNDMVIEKLGASVEMMKNIFERMGYENPEEEAWLLGAIMDGLSMDLAIMPGYDLLRMKRYLYKKYKLDKNEPI